ncbi:MAG: hypothetical protein L0G27_07665 [Paracoccus sp. (in: a-proteobacteria)]|nr:hypothetical protein [Paracoccus sp. (in: a-proteobacteria)]
MSFNHENPENDARKHKPALIAIVVALIVAALVFVVFQPGTSEPEGDGIATTAPPSDTPVTDAEGLSGDAEAPGSPGGETPADASPAATPEGAAPADQ